MNRRRRLPTDPVEVTIEDLTHEGHGVTHVSGKTVFIPDTLPGEVIQFVYTDRKRNFDSGKLLSIKHASPDRVTPPCRHFETCGGCNLQHLASDKQVVFKQKILIDNLQRIGHVDPAMITSPITGKTTGYRRKARLGVKYVIKKERLLIGFRERASHFLADITQCETLDHRIGHKLNDIIQLLRSLSCYQQIPQIEIAAGDEQVALVIRHLAPLTAADIQKLTDAAKLTGWHIYQQPGGLDSITAIWPPQSTLTYRIDNDQLELQFLPSDFIQVNRDVNLAMIDAAIAALELTPQTRVLELFSGLGNFTLPIARRSREVIAVEGEAGLVARARANAARNHLTNIHHYMADLTNSCRGMTWTTAAYDRWFLDPPRTGAYDILIQLLCKPPPRIVYVSCNPATLARDANLLVNQHGYRLAQVGILDMFPHTAHTEALAVFVNK